ncbi:hypothetical protein BC628DRAFT_1365720 [Trametes gibbosa]|uniref:DUF3669 domain-containing protein n=1 Tax=Trametes gibbosa TaxID=160864 RepID=A0A6G6FQR2_9APHY|nr:hypothetical protein BC628DRAFT_1365720 [Trametes gibbosa]QIE48523.1 hypothetical protein [Trametes gibbosa]
MRPFRAHDGDMQDLVDSFFTNDPYYPRPDPENVLYQEFRKACLAECPQDLRHRAAQFIAAIEQRRALALSLSTPQG